MAQGDVPDAKSLSVCWRKPAFTDAATPPTVGMVPTALPSGYAETPLYRDEGEATGVRHDREDVGTAGRLPAVTRRTWRVDRVGRQNLGSSFHHHGYEERKTRHGQGRKWRPGGLRARTRPQRKR